MTVRVVLPVAVLLALFFTQDVYLSALTAQTTTTVTKTVQNPDGTYTIIEYPVKKEVMVELRPNPQLPDATGRARVLRDDDGTRLDVSVAFAGQKTEMLEKKGAKYRGWRISNLEFKTCVGTVILIEGGVVTKTNETCRGTIIAQDVPEVLNVYAVDDHGVVTALGPLSINNGSGKMTATTPLSKFMLVISPEAALTAFEATTAASFTSVVPEGFTVIPLTTPSSGEKVAAVAASTTATAVPLYPAPMLNIPTFKKGDDTKLRSNLRGALTAAKANVFITPRNDGPTEIRLRLHDLKDVPAGKSFILWAVSSDNKFVRLGQLVIAGGENEVEIRAETTLSDFGLLITMEDASATSIEAPAGPIVATVHVAP